ncbi:hypothetical protein PAXRUDRAFT_27946 [Paxillus rubicundulus Ve08.2h10]|uniref:Uncharacterized protein n=1 Tax=Paxillus rubicundulus Ve08.2h10 TaxID=930991 RepID=A0A0D0DAY8_9AGAM|nr:hypothetical protein PAXRUDRAFT_27946 [Paxillus rubicundulus Ve08.2h10]
MTSEVQLSVVWPCIHPGGDNFDGDDQAEDLEPILELEDLNGEARNEVPLSVVLQHLVIDWTQAPDGYAVDANGCLVVNTAADQYTEVVTMNEEGGDQGKGKWRWVANRQFCEYEAHWIVAYHLPTITWLLLTK